MRILRDFKMDLPLIDRIKKLAIVALVSDDYLMEQLVFKGGNAIDLVYQISGRASMDLDFSIPAAFPQDDLSRISTKIQASLEKTYESEGLVPFDLSITQKPDMTAHTDEMQFWGGYAIDFKLIPNTLFHQHSRNIEALRKRSTPVHPNDARTLHIDISKFECCTAKEPAHIHGFTVYVYTTEMIVLEKIRAICQQHPDYRAIVKSHAPSARARDFFDIHLITQKYPLDFSTHRTKELLTACFQSKRVPLALIHQVATQRELHRRDYPSLRDTVRPGVDLKPFDYYFDYVVDMLSSIHIDPQNPLG